MTYHPPFTRKMNPPPKPITEDEATRDAREAKEAKKVAPTPPPIPVRKKVVESEVVESEVVESEVVESEVVESEVVEFPEWKKSDSKADILAVAVGLGLIIDGDPVSDDHTKKVIITAIEEAEAAANEDISD